MSVIHLFSSKNTTKATCHKRGTHIQCSIHRDTDLVLLTRGSGGRLVRTTTHAIAIIPLDPSYLLIPPKISVGKVRQTALLSGPRPSDCCVIKAPWLKHLSGILRANDVNHKPLTFSTWINDVRASSLVACFEGPFLPSFLFIPGGNRRGRMWIAAFDFWSSV